MPLHPTDTASQARLWDTLGPRAQASRDNGKKRRMELWPEEKRRTLKLGVRGPVRWFPVSPAESPRSTGTHLAGTRRSEPFQVHSSATDR